MIVIELNYIRVFVWYFYLPRSRLIGLNLNERIFEKKTIFFRRIFIEKWFWTFDHFIIVHLFWLTRKITNRENSNESRINNYWRHHLYDWKIWYTMSTWQYWERVNDNLPVCHWQNDSVRLHIILATVCSSLIVSSSSFSSLSKGQPTPNTYVRLHKR
jgi:hypothetical protein